jgi:oligoendopeptidase F
MAIAKILERKDVPVALTWNLESVFATNADWESELVSLKADYPKIAEYKGKLNRGNNGNNLLAVLQLGDAISERVSRLHTYAQMRSDEDTNNTLYQDMVSRANVLERDIATASAFISPEILRIKPERISMFLQKNKALDLYRHMLDDLMRARAHTLDVDIEEILANSSDLAQGPSDINNMFDNADLKLPTIKGEDDQDVEMTQGNYSVLLDSQDRGVRQRAYEAMMGSYHNWRNTLAAMYSAQVKANMFYARTRKYGSAIEHALSSNNIPISVYDNLISSVHANLPVLHRYLELRKRVLALDELHMWDLYVPLVPTIKYEVTYEKAKEIVLQAVAPLGDAYCQVLSNGLNIERWVDVLESKGKRSGAYSWGSYGTHPFMLLNWQDELSEMFTLAHEAGHSMHSYYTRGNQPYVYSGYTTFVAEVASTFNEGLLAHLLLTTTDDRALRAYIINDELEKIRTTLFRQTLFAEFERQAHALAEAGESLTPDSLGEIHWQLNQKYYGAAVTVDDHIRNEWSRIPHFYTSFYVFQYATGISAATMLVDQVLREGEPAVKRYLNFLSGGSSKYSIDLLKGAGVDLTTSEPVDKTLAIFGEKLAELEGLLS